MSVDNTNHQDSEYMEEQAKHIAGLLDDHAQRLSMRTLKQLENGRKRAITAHQQGEGATVNADGTLSQWITWVGHHRVAFVGILLAAMIASFVMLQNSQNAETSDAFLLGADLPPEAFVDRGFEPSLNRHINI